MGPQDTRVHLRLSPRQIQAIASCICGDDSDEAFEYRRMVDIDAFISFTGAQPGEFGVDGLSRWNYAIAFLDACQATDERGASGLLYQIERVIEALLNLREFSSEDKRDQALLRVNEILKGVPVEARLTAEGSAQLASTKRTRPQQVLDKTIHTAFGQMIAESALAAPRAHYAKATRFLTASDPDYENAAKEAVSSLESLVRKMTGEPDYTRAIRKAAAAGLIPRPIDEIAIKLFAYRGNEPGVAHGAADVPGVTAGEAWLVYNLSASLGAYLAERLRVDDASAARDIS